MLVHRLPVTEAMLAEAPHPEPDMAPRLHAAAAAAALLGLDLAGVTLMAGLLAVSHDAAALLPLPAFIAASLATWLLAARVTAVSRQSRSGQLGAMLRAACITCLLAIPPILCLAVPDSQALARPDSSCRKPRSSPSCCSPASSGGLFAEACWRTGSACSVS